MADNRTVTNNSPLGMTLRGVTIPGNGGSATVDFDALTLGEKHAVSARVLAGVMTVSGGWTLPADPPTGQAAIDAAQNAALAAEVVARNAAITSAEDTPTEVAGKLGMLSEPTMFPGGVGTNLLGFQGHTVATLPAPTMDLQGWFDYATDGRKVSEVASGPGTGCPVYCDGTAWLCVATDLPVVGP